MIMTPELSARFPAIRPSYRAILAMVALAATATAGPVLAAGHGAASSPCSALDAGGAWASYGHDATNTRTQSAETTLMPAPGTGLAMKWSFATVGNVQSTPVVSGGCVYATTGAGEVYALDAATGAKVWQHTLPPTTPGPLGGVIPGSPAVVGDQVIVLVSQDSAPYALSLDARTGAVKWQSAPVNTQPGVYTNASAAVHKGVIVFGYSPPEGEDGGQGGVALLDAKSGTFLKDVPTVPLADQAGFSGGGIWSTAAFDGNGYAYVGAGNPFSKTQAHPHTDAILKIDVNEGRSTFGQIVGYAPGEVDQYSTALQQLQTTPACAQTAGNGLSWPLDDPACGQLDLDFGASPNLIPVGGGGLLVGDLQKSGEYHAADAATMKPAWATVIGGSCAACNAASTAYDGAAIYAVGTPGSAMWSLNPATGAVNWASPVADGVHYQSVSVANGVVYTSDGNGFLDEFSAATGQPIAKQPLDAGVGDTAGGLSSSGIAIADHEVLVGLTNTGAGTAGYVVAYG